MFTVALRASRIATRASLTRSVALTTLRAISTSAPRFASEVPKNPFEDPKFQAIQEKLQASPDALNAVMDLARVLQSKGIDTSGGRISPMQMMKLGMDSEVRAAVQKMSEECQKAGVPLDQETMQAMAEKLQGK
ncbi:hypothetical protein DB88DRAFT_478191 [Papiliotrema laurentii]|uniref:Uncharacterized protein n=1 Tax=Papiliotrema laurentii TaxID=5418 RepID=A0AAD9L9N3_PAPLA|nr:hypothetical protein DB88DRAFT_478191 [Papiliotrema laurentii]